ncbi:DUF4190 domain-containing protein [Nocardia veterana]|uniref:DUF4870 domain-containing protein n=1 Tax=Nocardia veterana TaxID=132249 RepID=A0A7X6LVN2_9NOCA|nr:DUF4190 domain-containing protein [Nocardia veterana]NKY85438.1 DUF4870 domain-containing protein [Nocardia veterana]
MTDQPPPGSYPPPEPYPQQPGAHPGPAGEYPQQPGQYPGGYPPPPPGEYPGPPGQGAWQEPKGKGLAITALVLGIIALLSCWTILGGILFGLIAVVFGIIATVKARRGTAAGGGMAIAGLVLGLLGLIAGIVIAVIGVNFFVNNGGKDFLDCVNKANGDQSKIDQCQRDWNQTLENKYSVTLSPRPTS